MAILKITLTEDHLKLIRWLNLQEFEENETVGVAKDNLYGGTYKYEQMAFILGLNDKAIPDTKENIEGTVYEKETQLYMQELDRYIRENLLNIEEIVHQFIFDGLKPGIYVCKDYQHIWKLSESL